MAAQAFAAGFHIVSNDGVSRPPTAKVTAKPPSVEELDAIELPNYGLTKTNDANGVPRTAEPREPTEDVPKTPNELERSQPPTPKQDEATNIVPAFWYPKMNRWRVLSACTQYFGNGLNDSAPGALIPYIEQWYGIGYAVVSTLFISNAVGKYPGQNPSLKRGT